MASAGPSTAEPREDTPLLQADASPTTSTSPRDDHDEQEPQVATDIQTSISRIDKRLRVLFALVIGVGSTALGLNIARIVMGSYGSERFGYYDYPSSMSYDWQLFWEVVLAVVTSIFNLVHLSKRGRPLPDFLNILIFFIDGCVALIAGFDALSSSNSPWGTRCRYDLDDPDPHWGTPYPGSLKECYGWEQAYCIVTWVWLSFELVTSLLMLTVVVKSFMRVYARRYRRVEGETEGRRWTIPAGQVNFEFSVYWGGPAPRSEVRRRPAETVQEDSQEA